MSYLKVQWLDAKPSEPVLIYTELDAERWELRKVEVFADGRMRFSDAHTPDDAPFGLSLEPIPSLDEILRDPHFLAEEISADEFEPWWKRALAAEKKP